MTREQEAFDEAFDVLAGEFALDDVIDKLLSIGVVVNPWQREILARWVDEQDVADPLPVRVIRLFRMLREAKPEPGNAEWQERCWRYMQDLPEGGLQP